MQLIFRLFNAAKLKQRPLTQQEIVLAQSIFANHIDYARIRICAHVLVMPGYAISPNGNIYFNRKDYCDDFSSANLALKSWFIHELVHVWQYQQGIAVLRKALFNRRYDYVLELGKLFSAYGVEQQAQMVQDYFLKRAQGQACADLAACIPFLKANNKPALQK